MSDIIQLVNEQEELFLPAVTDKSVEWSKECQFAIQAFQANDFLAKAALSNPASAQNAIINIAAIGVSLNPALKHAYLIPRSVKKGNQWVQTVCLDISYMGMINLAVESGSVKRVDAVIVRANDTFKMKGLASEPIHEYQPFGDRGEIVGAYCSAQLSDGSWKTEIMTINQIWDVRSRSESFKKGFGPWKTDEEEMIKKTVVKRGYKYWPKVKRLAAAIEYQNTEAGEGVVIDQEPVMRHTSAEDEADLIADRESKLSSEVQVYIDQMEIAQNQGELQGAFASAYRMTKGHKEMNQQVQKIYNENKVRIG